MENKVQDADNGDAMQEIVWADDEAEEESGDAEDQPEEEPKDDDTPQEKEEEESEPDSEPTEDDSIDIDELLAGDDEEAEDTESIPEPRFLDHIKDDGEKAEALKVWNESWNGVQKVQRKLKEQESFMDSYQQVDGALGDPTRAKDALESLTRAIYEQHGWDMEDSYADDWVEPERKEENIEARLAKALETHPAIQKISAVQKAEEESVHRKQLAKAIHPKYAREYAKLGAELTVEDIEQALAERPTYPKQEAIWMKVSPELLKRKSEPKQKKRLPESQINDGAGEVEQIPMLDGRDYIANAFKD